MSKPRGKYQQKQWDARQAAILKALESLAIERGFNDLTMDDLADAVGISKATLYQHFNSKDEMLVSLMVQHYERFFTWLESTAAQSPLERLRGVMGYMVSEQITPLRGLMRIGNAESVSILYSDPTLTACHRRVMDSLMMIAAEGQAAGDITAELAPSVIISAIWALSNVSLREDVPAHGNETIPKAADFTKQMMRLFERAVKP